MKAAIKNYVCVILLAAVALVAAAAIMSFFAKEASADMGSDTTVYELYPTPHSVEYESGTVTLPARVGVKQGNVDEATSAHLYAALALADTVGYTEGELDFNVYIGIKGSGDVADKYVLSAGITYASDLFEGIDSYLLYVGNGAIVILGKDTDAAYYGVTTLMAILEKSGATVRKLKVQDKSDCEFRGFIEGYYGIPWTTDERVELMRFGSRFKTNIYIYAPKDDPYHSTNWRGLYSDTDLDELKEQIRAGRETKTRFAWAIHPFLYDRFKKENYSADFKTVRAKFQQLYDAGVRQFVISADDVSNTDPLDPEMQRQLLNDISAWCKDKGDCYDLIFVPSIYFYSSPAVAGVELSVYYQKLTTGLDPSVYIMWTGNMVCSSVKEGRFAEFGTLTGGRKPFMWMNWPVNDYAQEYVLLGKGDVYNKTYAGEPQFLGIVTNPMPTAEASKLSIFATADYCWNINGFNAKRSHEDSFKYIEGQKGEQLAALCEHLVNATKFEGAYFEESTSFVQPIQDFRAEAAAGSYGDAASALRQKYIDLSAAATEYLSGAQNTALKAELEPWINSLRLLADVCADYLEVLINPDLTKAELVAINNRVQAALAAREECCTYILDAVTYNHIPRVVAVSPSVLTPFFDELSELAVDELALRADVNSGVTYRGFDGIYQGSIQNITDGDDGTFAWFNGYPQPGAYIRLDLGAPTQVSSVRVYTGKPDGDDVMPGRVEYSLDGRTYTEIGNLSGALTAFDLSAVPVTARFIRIVYTGDGSTWIAVREVTVATV